MTVEELNRAAQKSEKLQNEQKQRAGFGQVLLAGAISALVFRKPLASILRRMDMSIGSVLLERFPKIAKFTGAVINDKIDYSVLKKVLGTVKQTAPEISNSLFLKSVADKIDTSTASIMIAKMKQLNLPAESIKAMQSVQYGALSLSGFAAYSLASRLTGNKSDQEKGYFNYFFTRGIPFFAAGVAASAILKNDELTGMLKELPFINRVRESVITMSERLTDLPNYITASIKTGSELTGRKLGLEYFKEFNRVFERNLGEIRSSSLYDSAIGLRELLGFARKASQYMSFKTYRMSDIEEMASSVIKDINERFGEIDSRMYKALGLEPASIKQLIDIDALDKNVVTTLEEFSKNFNVDLSKIKAGEGITIKDGVLRLVDTPRKAVIKASVESTKYMRIPYIFFNPVSLLQPRLVKEYMERGVYSVMAGDNVVPTKEGPLRIYEFAIDFINKQMPDTFNKEYIETLPKDVKRNISSAFRLEIAGNKPYLSIDVYKTLDYAYKPENILDMYGEQIAKNRKMVLDVSEELGEGYALRKSSIGGSITRAINMQQGMNIPKQARTKWQALDLPFNNLNNIGDPFYVKMYKKMKSLLGGSEFGGIFGLNKLEKARKLALEGNQWGQNEIASLFRIVSANNMPYEALEELSKMPHTTLGNTLKLASIYSQDDVLNRYIEYMRGRASLLRSLGDKAEPLRVFSPSQMEWRIYSEMRSLEQSGKRATSAWLEEVVTEAGETRMDIIRKSTTFGILATRENPVQAVEELAKTGKYSQKLIYDLGAVAKYAQSEQLAYTWSSILKNKRVPIDKIVNPEIIETMHSRIKKSSNFFNSYLKLIGDRIMPENMASKNVYMFVKRSKQFYEIEGANFGERFWKYMSQMFPTPKDRSSGTLTGILGFYTSDRTVQLFEAIGLGRPNYESPSVFTKLLEKFGIENRFAGANMLGSLESVISKRVLPVAIGVAALGYANYKLKEQTGIDVKKGLLETSKLALEGAAVVSQNIGLTEFSRYMKDNFPGALPLAGGAAGYYTSGAFGLLFGGGIGALAENIPYAKTVQLEFEGEKSVNVRQGRFWEIGNCVSKETLIQTSPSDYKPAEKIEVGDTVVSHDGLTHKVLKVYKRELLEGEMVYDLYLSSSSDNITVTEGHPVLVYSAKTCQRNKNNKCKPMRKVKKCFDCSYYKDNVRDSISWKAVEDVEPGDFLAIAINKISKDINQIRITDYINKDERHIYLDRNGLVEDNHKNSHGKYYVQRKPVVKNTIDIDYDLGWVFGYFFAEGNLVFSKSETELSANLIETVSSINEGHFCEKFSSLVNKKFGITPKISVKKQSGKNNTLRTRCYSTILAKLFYEILYKDGDKYIPDYFFSFGEEFVIGFLHGMFDGDGTKHNKNSFSIKSSRKQQAVTVQKMFIALGLNSSITVEKSHNPNHKDVYMISFNGFQNGAFLEYFHSEKTGEIKSNKNLNSCSFFYNGLYFSLVRKKHLSEYSEDVYDFEVEDSHTFTTQDGVILHNSPYMGGKVVYSRPHLLYLAGTDWQYTDALWGSEKEYWQYKSYLPTPENMFGLRKLQNPYYFEERNQYMRPYPATGQSDITDFPIIGNLLQPLSYSIKPPRIDDTAMPYSTVGSSEAISALSGMSYDSIQQATKTSPGFVQLSRISEEQKYRAYYLQYPQIKYNPTIETSIRGQLKGSIKDLSDYFGMIGFMANTAFSGDESGEGISTPKIAHSGLAYSRERLYYQMQLGGMFGQSELFRRIVTRTQPTYAIDYINPLENRYFMENFNWLPKDYMIDFYHGDVYRSIGPYGEVRAPGPAYEATHKLYDNYGTLDRFLIMSNIAPYATETTVAERRITKELDRYTPEERYQIKQAIDNMSMQKERYDFREGAFSKQLTEQEITLGSYLGKGEFALVNKQGDQTDIKVKLAGVDLDVDSVARRIYETELNMPIEKAYAIASQQIATLERSFENLIGTTVKARVAEDESERYVFNSTSDIVMPVIIGDFNKNLAETYEGTRDTSGHWMNMRAVYGDSTTKSIWENIAHLNTFINRKFFGQESALEKYERDVVYGKSRKLWEHPVEDFLKPIFFNMANEGPFAAFGYGSYLGAMSGATPISRAFGAMFGGLAGFGTSILTPDNLKPKDTTDRWEMEAKYDAMQYMKEEKYGLRNKSLLGMKTADNVQRASNKLPRIEREFFRSFVNAPESQREEILSNTPVYMQELLKHFWRLKEEAITAQLSSLELPKQSLDVDWGGYEEYSRSLVEDNINWEGYDRYIDLKKLRTLEAFNRFNDYSKFEIYGSDIRSAMNDLLDTEQIYGNSYQLLSNTVNTYYAMKSIGQLNGAGIMGFSVAPQYNGANITFVKR